MSKKLAILAGMGILVGLVSLALAVDYSGQTSQISGKSNIAHLMLYQKNPADWSVIADGAWGRMRYNQSGATFDFVFNGHDLTPGVSYTLIYYPDPWPGIGLICLGIANADDFGNVHIKGSQSTGPLPAEYDNNCAMGAKIWLVKSSDVSCGNEMVGWNPSAYLFENNLITFYATDSGTPAEQPPSAEQPTTDPGTPAEQPPSAEQPTTDPGTAEPSTGEVQEQPQSPGSS